VSPFGNSLLAIVGTDLTAALFEEFGWRRYARPCLVTRHSAPVAMPTCDDEGMLLFAFDKDRR
jgi:hypothetical protein